MNWPKPKSSKPCSKIAQARRKVGLTQKELAKHLGVTVHTVANWENGRVDLWFIVIVIKLCEILNCPPKNLIEFNTDLNSERNALSLEEMRERLGTNELQVTSVTDMQEKEES